MSEQRKRNPCATLSGGCIKPRGIALLARARVQRFTVVDNSDFSPTRLTFPIEATYSSLSEGNCPFSSFQAKRIPNEPTCVLALILPHVLSRAALYPVLAPSRSCPVESSSQDAHHAPPSAQAPLPGRLPRLSPRLHCLVGWRTSASACASLVRGQKPAGSTQASEHRRLRLPQSAVPVLRDHRCTHSCTGWRWQAWPCRAHPDRKSTRLNSSHEWISYAVFCLKKKKEKNMLLLSTSKKNSKALIDLSEYTKYNINN